MSVLDFSRTPCSVVITNSSTKDKKINISGFSQSFILPARASVSLKAKNSSELVGYWSQLKDEVVIEFPGFPERGLTILSAGATVSVTSERGTVVYLPGDVIPNGTQIVVTVTPDPGYSIDPEDEGTNLGITGCSSSEFTEGARGEFSIATTVTGDVSITATQIDAMFNLTIVHEDNCTVAVTGRLDAPIEAGANVLPLGSEVIVTVTPTQGFSLSAPGATLTGSASDETLSFQGSDQDGWEANSGTITGDISIDARAIQMMDLTATLSNCTLSASYGDPAIVHTVTALNSLPMGATVALTLTPAETYTLADADGGVITASNGETPIVFSEGLEGVYEASIIVGGDVTITATAASIA